MKKKHRATKAQKLARKRNWSKGLIMCTISQIESMKKTKSCSFAEQMKILKCKRMLEEIIKDWKPVL